jgi:CheY-like chemotaxis protein
MADVDILLVEDNPGDVRLIEEAFADRELPGSIHPVKTGEDALDWLYRRDSFTDVPRPDLVLLDLNLSAASGQAVLDEIKSDPRLRRLPVIVLTGSRSDDDLIAAYEACANAYLVKPIDPEVFTDRIQTLMDFWVSTATLPPGVDACDTDHR